MDQISKDIQDRLDKINWESLRNKYGISKDSITSNPHIASQLAFGQMTDLVPGNVEDLSGMFSLRAYPVKDSDEYRVKVYTMEKAKTPSTLFLYNQPITSENVKKALLEKTDWRGNDGTVRFGYANANGGRPVAIEMNGEKEQFLVSIHQPTNRVVGMPVNQVKSYLMDRDGNSRGRGMYGVEFSQEQIESLCEGKAVRMDGCRNKEGMTFSCYVQFDAAQRQVVCCHPTFIKEAQKAGTDLGLDPKKTVDGPAETTGQKKSTKSAHGVRR